ncbi:phosphatase PAP2 family protein [Soonwooa sp.]|uniref:phosphatase PAP2 family protein n=1 Tax=Soonwooa sp. TaxID=1938592 RepID=UPI0026109257|nr:phosphatase PAP2 family protein [Soonwooa sp.]
MHEFIDKDRQLLLFLNNLGDASYDPFWLLITGTWIWVPLYIIFLYLLFKTYKAKSVFFILIFIALGVAFTDQIAGIFKYGIARLRPCHDEALIPKMRMVTCGGQYGFFSSHAANTFFLATFLTILLSRKFRWLPVGIFAWAAIVSYSRIYLGVHFPFDVAFGAAVGFLSGGLFAEITKIVLRKQKSI